MWDTLYKFDLRLYTVCVLLKHAGLTNNSGHIHTNSLLALNGLSEITFRTKFNFESLGPERLNNCFVLSVKPVPCSQVSSERRIKDIPQDSLPLKIPENQKRRKTQREHGNDEAGFHKFNSPTCIIREIILIPIIWRHYFQKTDLTLKLQSFKL